MTKEELKKEAKEYAEENQIYVGEYCSYNHLVKAYLAGAEPREKQIQIDAEQIRALQKDKGTLIDENKVLKQDFADWKRQGLIYSWLMKQNGLEVKHCKFIALLKDHSKADARNKPDYPKQPVFVFEFDVTADDLAEIETFIEARVKALEFADTLKDEELTPCTKEERWTTPEKWAHMKEGRKSAIKLYDSEEEAAKVELKKDEYIEHRPGENKKCDNYCNCREWCPLFKKEVTE